MTVFGVACNIISCKWTLLVLTDYRDRVPPLAWNVHRDHWVTVGTDPETKNSVNLPKLFLLFVCVFNMFVVPDCPQSRSQLLGYRDHKAISSHLTWSNQKTLVQKRFAVFEDVKHNTWLDMNGWCNRKCTTQIRCDWNWKPDIGDNMLRQQWTIISS